MRYKPGDKVWATVRVFHPVVCPLQKGEYRAVVKGLAGRSLRALEMANKWNETVYDIDMEEGAWGDAQWIVVESNLRPRHDPYEGDQAGDWNNCPLFNPLKETA